MPALALIAAIGVVLATTPGASQQSGAPVKWGRTSEVGTKDAPKRVKMLRIDEPGVYENYLVDAEWGDFDAVQIKADGVTLRNCEIRNGLKDGVEVYGNDVVIENCRIHHFLAGTFKEQKDAHGITGRPMRLTVRNCEIGLVSGDCLQFDPGRGVWGDVTVENCVLYAGKLSEDAAGFKKGERPGENGIDTKQLAKNPRSTMTVRNCVVKGFGKGGQIDNAAGLNLKDHVEVTVQHCLFYDNEICLRLRGPADAKRGGAKVTVTDCAFYDSDIAIRTEDGIEGLKILRPGFGKGVLKRMKQVGKVGSGFEMIGEHEAPETTNEGR